MHTAGTARAQRGGGGGCRCSRGIDVVHERKRARQGRLQGAESACDVLAPSRAGEPALPGERASAPEHAPDRKPPAEAELEGESLGRMMAALEDPVSVRWHEDERLDRRWRQRLCDQVGCGCGELPDPPLLPGGDQSRSSTVVPDRGPSGGKREAPSAALAAALDGPRRRRAAPGAERAVQPRKRCATRRAEWLAGAGADGAALWQQ